MINKKLKNNLNISFSLAVMLLIGFVIVKSILADHSFVKGYVDEIDCHVDAKSDDTYSYYLKTSNNERFTNRLDIPCKSIAKIEIGDPIEVESYGHIFVQVTHKGVELFDKNMLSMKRSGVNVIFTLLFILAACDIVYRLFFYKINK
jgi:hypothetical protein